MAQNKTQPTDLDPDAVIASLAETRRNDARALDALMRRLTDLAPVMWGAEMFGYGTYTYRYATGHAGTYFRTGFAVRKREFVIYVMSGFSGMDADLARLGPHKTGKCCLYLKRLDGIDLEVLERIIAKSLSAMAQRYPQQQPDQS